MTVTISEVQSALDYDPSTGTFVWRWRADVPLTVNRQRAGKTAGCVWTCPRTGGQYILIRLKDKLLYAHRLAWLLEHGEWPPRGYDLDHVNGDGTDNRIANLRLASRSQNHMNQRRRRDNKSGFKGVYLRKDTGKFSAEIKANGKRWSLGCFDTVEEAAAVRARAAEEIHGSFARME